ncbi:MAG TPA: hypothetical protein DET40_12265 [Lentisphaeria bacterium]|nr:MAG: hypothetical protein A2X45_07815 [Lentisphaerae bacterium GWF2_50_93]HCE44314.1 hypothetical protein [Lentisphaeria bacterium]
MFSSIKETLYKFIAYTIFGILALYGVLSIAVSVKHGDGAGLVIGLVYVSIAGFLFAYLIIPAIGDRMAFGFYTPKNVKPMPPEFPLIRAKIARKEYAEAVADLRGLLEKDPGNYHVIALLVEVFVDRTDDYENAIGLITAYLKKEDRCADDIPIVMRLVDVYLDIDEKARAAELLDNELKMKYAEMDLKQIRKRLEGMG